MRKPTIYLVYSIKADAAVRARCPLGHLQSALQINEPARHISGRGGRSEAEAIDLFVSRRSALDEQVPNSRKS